MSSLDALVVVATGKLAATLQDLVDHRKIRFITPFMAVAGIGTRRLIFTCTPESVGRGSEEQTAAAEAAFDHLQCRLVPGGEVLHP